MSTILEKPIKVRRIVATSSKIARALEDPIRTKILKTLYKKQLSAEQISDQIRKTGLNKALTTIRHHLEILKNSGLIEVVKIQESRGAVTKYFGTSTKLLEFSIPDDFDSKYSQVIKSTSTKIEKLIMNISQRTASKNKNSSSKDSEGYNQYLLIEIINRAMTNVLEKSSKISKSN